MCNYASLEKQHFEAMYKAALKEICNELDFPNLSFFGRFVKNI